MARTTDVFKTQHSVEHNHRVAVEGLILLTEIGSTMHGVSVTDTGDDVDEMGVCIEGPDDVIGLGTFEQYEYRTQPVNHRSGVGDIDRVVYSLRKFVKLAAAGNPTVLMPLFVPMDSDLMRYCNAFGAQLREHTGMLLSKNAGQKFLGYLDGQRKRYLDPARQDSKHASRPELVEKYGWDTKTGYHALRIAIQGTQLMTSHHIELPMLDEHRAFLLDVRHGKYSKAEVTSMLEEQESVLTEAITTSSLPDYPDYDEVNRWLTRWYREHWEQRGL